MFLLRGSRDPGSPTLLVSGGFQPPTSQGWESALMSELCENQPAREVRIKWYKKVHDFSPGDWSHGKGDTGVHNI